MFRGKTYDGDWVGGDLIHAGKGMSIVKCDTFVVESSCEVIPESVGRYIGIEDKLKKDIYGNDIVKYIDGMRVPQIGLVVDLGYMAYIEAVGGDEEGNQDLELHPFNCDNVEIIGNKFDNPKLLKSLT